MATDGSDFLQEDCDTIATEMKDQEERIRLKRRWLLGLDTPQPENHTTEFLESEDHHNPGKTEFLESECLPESLLRKDDLFYETMKSRVEEAFGFCRNQDDAAQRKDSKYSTKDVVRTLSTYLDSLTNEGLSLVVNIITGGGSTSFDKTRPKMKQIIKESIRTDLKAGNRDDVVVAQLHQALTDPANFRRDCTMDSAKPMFPSHREAAVKILNELENSSTQTLLAMKRKLEGSVTEIPLRLKPSKRGGKKTDLINQVKLASEKMLSELSPGEKLQEPLAKAMSLVDLSLKLTPGYYYNNKTTTEFFQFSPETKKLQGEIVKAVWSLRSARVDAAFERVGLILDPESQVSNHSLRSAVERMLVEYLFDCCDMDVIPKSLTRALSFINSITPTLDHRVCPGEAVEEEAECILNVSAQVKQIVWECIPPDYELDQDFGDAYMEELEDSGDDDDDDYSQDDDALAVADPEQVEVGAECSVLNPAASSDATSQLVIRDLTESGTRAHPMSLFATPTSNKSTPVSDIKVVGVANKISPRSLYSVENIKSDDHHGAQKSPIKRNKKNQYLAVQEICDETSLVAYNLIGRLLEKFADQKGLVDQRSCLRGESMLQEDVEGDEVSEEKQASQFQGKSFESITLSAVQEIIPSLDKSVLLKLKEVME